VFVSKKMTVGVMFGWNTYYQKVARAAYAPSEEFAVTSESYRYVNATPMKAFVNYFLMRKTALQTYVGMGVGGVYMTQHAAFDTIDFRDSQWGFLVAPEAGLFYRFADHFAVHAAVSYQVSTNAFKFGQLDLHGTKNVVATVGITYML
jgi:outer membrane protein W